MHFFRRCHASVKVYVQRRNLFSRNKPSKEVAVLKKYPNKCPKKVHIAKRVLLQRPSWSGNVDASKKSASLK